MEKQYTTRLAYIPRRNALSEAAYITRLQVVAARKLTLCNVRGRGHNAPSAVPEALRISTS